MARDGVPDLGLPVDFHHRHHYYNTCRFLLLKADFKVKTDEMTPAFHSC